MSAFDSNQPQGTDLLHQDSTEYSYPAFEESKLHTPNPETNSADLVYANPSPESQHVPENRGWTQAEVQDPVYQPTSATSGKKPKFLDWIFEFLGVVVVIAGLAVLGYFLRVVDGQRLSSWTLRISINTVVSILATVIETAIAFIVGSSIGQSKWVFFTKRSGPLKRFVAFDQASRGLTGSLSLLWSLKSCHWASLGAWTTLALLIVQPFFQAVIVYQGQLDSVTGNNAAVVRATGLDVGTWVFEKNTLQYTYRGQKDVVGYYSIYPDAGVSATLLMSFVNSSTATPTQPPPFTCRTGNCTWPLFSTVGLCSRCVDISQHIEVEHDQGYPHENPFVTPLSSQSTFEANYTNYVLPYTAGRRLLLQFVDGLANETSWSIVAGRVPRIDLVPVYWPNETYSFQDSGTLLASFGILSAEQAYWDNRTKWQDAKMTATECALEFCGQVYQSVSEGGTLNETLITTDFDRVASSFEPTSADALIIMDEINEDFGKSLAYLDQMAYVRSDFNDYIKIIARTDLQLKLSDNINVPDSVQGTLNITHKAITTISSFLTDNSTLIGLTYSLSDSTNFSTSFETAARLLSNRFREMDGSVLSGTTEQWDVYTHVSWVFFYVPVAILAVGVIFTVGAVVQSYRQSLDNMSSNPMAMLLHGLDSETRENLRAEETRGVEGKTVVVRLEDEQYGLNLRSRN